jgi:hypothetical protein
MLDQPKKQRKRKPKELYIDGIGLHQWSLPLEMAGGGMARISLGDNNHAVLAWIPTDLPPILRTGCLESGRDVCH